MIILIAVENSYGLLFNDRRVSMDRVLRQKIVEISKGAHLWMDQYTASQFREGLPENAKVSETFLDDVGCGDFCFVEDKELRSYRNKIEAVYLFKWNRDYPSDFKLDFQPDRESMRLVKTEDFAGSSHEKITMEVWNKP